jgi:hypothetical protein
LLSIDEVLERSVAAQHHARPPFAHPPFPLGPQIKAEEAKAEEAKGSNVAIRVEVCKRVNVLWHTELPHEPLTVCGPIYRTCLPDDHR